MLSKKKKKNMHRFQFSASNRNQNCEIAPLPALLSLHSLIKKKERKKTALLCGIRLSDCSVRWVGFMLNPKEVFVQYLRVLFQTDVLITHCLQPPPCQKYLPCARRYFQTLSLTSWL